MLVGFVGRLFLFFRSGGFVAHVCWLLVCSGTAVQELAAVMVTGECVCCE